MPRGPSCSSLGPSPESCWAGSAGSFLPSLPFVASHSPPPPEAHCPISGYLPSPGAPLPDPRGACSRVGRCRRAPTPWHQPRVPRALSLPRSLLPYFTPPVTPEGTVLSGYISVTGVSREATGVSAWEAGDGRVSPHTRFRGLLPSCTFPRVRAPRWGSSLQRGPLPGR